MTMPSLQFPKADRESMDAPLRLVDFRDFAMRHRRLLAYCTIGAAVLSLAWTLLQPRSWVSASAFTPQARRSQAGLSGLAAQLGAALPLGDANQSPTFYADLARSRQVLGGVVDTPLDSSSMPGRTLIEVYNITRGSGPVRRERAIERLARDVQVGVSLRTGVVTLAVKARNPELALELNQRILAMINRYNLQSRQSQATAERDFTEGRLSDARAELREAEDRLQAFLLGNREVKTPALVIQEQRLRRTLTERQGAVTTLVQAFEQARIEEVRDTPVISMVEPANLPARPAPRYTLAKLLIGAVLGLLAGALVGTVRDRTRLRPVAPSVTPA